MTKKYQIRHHEICFFFKLKMHKTRFGRGSATDPLGELTTLPDPLVSRGGRYPLTIFVSLYAFWPVPNYTALYIYIFISPTGSTSKEQKNKKTSR